MSGKSANPFDPRVVLGLLLFGGIVFVALLWFLGKGMTGGQDSGSGSHAGGLGLDGYAAFSRYLEARGLPVRRVRSQSQLEQPGLLIMTPPHNADPKALNRIVEARRTVGPTIIVTPKWRAVPAKYYVSGAKPGWVMLGRADVPDWQGFHDDITVGVQPMREGGAVAGWHGLARSGTLPNSEFVLSGRSSAIVPLVVGADDGRLLAGYVLDEGDYPALAELVEGQPPYEGDDDTLFPVIFVFEPDLINNYGMDNRSNAELGEALVRAARDGFEDQPVWFDMTLNGYGSSTNLLTLAFKPPFLAATLTLILAALAVAWRAFNRFGPPRAGTRAIAFGKRALVGNAAGLIRRARRLHLLGAPYADAARERLARALALPVRADAEATEDAIDRALAARAPGRTPFSVLAARLRGAARPTEILRAARDLHALERTLTR